MQKYSKSRLMNGDLYFDNTVIKNVKFEFLFNPYNTNSMNLFFRDLPPGQINQMKYAEKAWIQTEQEFPNNNTISFDPKLISSSNSAYIAKQVNSFESLKVFDDLSLAGSISIDYYFPLTSLTDLHQTLGLYFNDKGNRKQIIKTSLGNFELSDIIEIEEEINEIKCYHFNNIIRESILSISIICGNNDPFLFLQEADLIADQICKFISIIENDRIYWKRKAFNFSNEAKTIAYGECFRWAPPATPKYGVMREFSQIKNDTLGILFNAYQQLTAEKKEIINKFLENFEIANCSKTIETTLIHWHSCLDTFRKYSKVNLANFKKTNNHSRDIVSICDILNINLTDLFKSTVLTDLRNNFNNAQFDYAKYRNQYIHDGFDSIRNDYDNILKENKTIRLLSERLLLKLLDVDYETTCLGK